MTNLFLPNRIGLYPSSGWCVIARREVHLGQASTRQMLPLLPQTQVRCYWLTPFLE